MRRKLLMSSPSCAVSAAAAISTEVMNQKRKLKQQLNLQKRRLDYMHTELDKKVHLVARTHEAHAKMKIDYITTVRTQGVTGSAEDVKEIRELQRQRAEYDEQVTSIVSQITQANSDIDLLEHQKRHMLKVYFAEVGKPPPVLPDGTGYATTDQSVPRTVLMAVGWGRHVCTGKCLRTRSWPYRNTSKR